MVLDTKILQQILADGALSVREIDIIGLVYQGARNKEIAAVLLISENTVKTHIHHIITKLHVANRTQVAVIIAQRLAQRVPV